MTKPDFKPSYIGPRNDILEMIPDKVNRVLDIGCSTGSLGKRIKETHNAEVYGVEIDKKMAEIAKKNIDKVLVGNVENIDFLDDFFKDKFDLIIFGDVLEHLINPWKLLKDSTKVLDESGMIIASIPNVKHYSTFYNVIVKNEWPYRERGIFDRTHLRFFTLKNIKEMFKDSDLKIIKVRRKYRIIESPSIINIISKIFALPLIRDLITHQYLILARKN
jgi:methionine biosynthesis protein MetW